MIARNPNLSSPGATGISNPHQRTPEAITEQRSKYITVAIPMTAITDCVDRVRATNGDIDEETKESHRVKTRLVCPG
jgi:hypothetical protein